MIQIGENPNQKRENYCFSEATKILEIHDGNKQIGRTKIMEILRTCNVLDRWNKPYYQFEDSGYFKSEVKKHAPGGRIKRKDPVTLVVGEKGLEFVKKVVTDYIENKSIPFETPPTRFLI
ncbi:MAG: phage antirepressor KilAC domain-containing protein [Bacteroidota bacterium]